jgi:TPR repeat protein
LEHTGALFMLGILNAKGIGTPTNIDAAEKYLISAQNAGHPEAGKFLTSLRDQNFLSKFELKSLQSTPPTQMSHH